MRSLTSCLDPKRSLTHTVPIDGFIAAAAGGGAPDAPKVMEGKCEVSRDLSCDDEGMADGVITLQALYDFQAQSQDELSFKQGILQSRTRESLPVSGKAEDVVCESDCVR